MTKPLFIPLRTEYFDAFCDGSKDTEFRPYGPRWNESTCWLGRPVTLSKGYGKKHRRTGRIVGFKRSKKPTTSKAWRACYGGRGGFAACIKIELEGES